jgi:integrase/recombinase XerD
MKLSKAIEGYEFAMLGEGYSKLTLIRYQGCLFQLCEYLNDPDVGSIVLDDLKSFFHWLRVEYKPQRPNGNKEPLSFASLYSYWKAIRSLYNWAVKELNIERPDNNLKAPKYTSKVISPFSKEEIECILNACQFSKLAQTNGRKQYKIRRLTAKRDRALVLLLLDTGLRVSECGRLRIKDVDFESGKVLIQPHGSGQKTKSRNVFLGRAAKSALWQYLADRENSQPGDPLFITTMGRPMNRTNIRSICRRLGERTGISGVDPHPFRHTFAIQFLRNGGDVFSLQRLLGHSTLEMVKNYLSIAMSDVQQAHMTSSPVDRWHL